MSEPVYVVMDNGKIYQEDRFKIYAAHIGEDGIVRTTDPQPVCHSGNWKHINKVAHLLSEALAEPED